MICTVIHNLNTKLIQTHKSSPQKKRGPARKYLSLTLDQIHQGLTVDPSDEPRYFEHKDGRVTCFTGECRRAVRNYNRWKQHRIRYHRDPIKFVYLRQHIVYKTDIVFSVDAHIPIADTRMNSLIKLLLG